MPKLKSLYLYPYSGWPHRPWEHHDEEDVALDIDAAARSARRVTESLTREVEPLQLNAPRTRFMAMCHPAAGSDVEVMPYDRVDDDFLGHVLIPHGFRHVLPSRRADLLTEAFEHLLTAAAIPLGWDPDKVRDAVGRVRDAEYACAWQSPWRLTRDRQRRVRLEGYLEDDGYLRCHIVVAGRDNETPLVSSQTWIGWTWIENLNRAAKAMRFIDRDRLMVPSGSGIDETLVTVDLVTGDVTREPAALHPLNYPGDPGYAAPQITVRLWEMVDG